MGRIDVADSCDREPLLALFCNVLLHYLQYSLLDSGTRVRLLAAGMVLCPVRRGWIGCSVRPPVRNSDLASRPYRGGCNQWGVHDVSRPCSRMPGKHPCRIRILSRTSPSFTFGAFIYPADRCDRDPAAEQGIAQESAPARRCVPGRLCGCGCRWPGSFDLSGDGPLPHPLSNAAREGSVGLWQLECSATCPRSHYSIEPIVEDG